MRRSHRAEQTGSLCDTHRPLRACARARWSCSCTPTLRSTPQSPLAAIALRSPQQSATMPARPITIGRCCRRVAGLHRLCHWASRRRDWSQATLRAPGPGLASTSRAVSGLCPRAQPMVIVRRRAAVAVGQLHSGAARVGRPTVAPLKEREQGGEQLEPLLGQPVLVAGPPAWLAVGLASHDALFDERASGGR